MLKISNAQALCINSGRHSGYKENCDIYQRKWDRSQRHSYLKQVDEAFHRLADAPKAGEAGDDIRDGYKKFSVGSHLIFYLKGASDAIENFRILYKRLDVEAGLSEFGAKG